MAGRKEKNTVDYFPHKCKHGKKLYIIENKFGNDGYTFWFKLLELLGSNAYHYIDCRMNEIFEYLLAYTKVDEEKATNILITLSKLDAIHKELWEHKIIWSNHFIENLKDVYDRRTNTCMNFYNLCEHLSVKLQHKYDIHGNIVNRNTQSKEKESKEKESKDNNFDEFLDLFNEITLRNFRKTEKYQKQFNARIKEGFKLEDFQKAIKNCKNDPYHRQNPKYLTPEFITRPDKLQQYLNYKSKDSSYD